MVLEEAGLMKDCTCMLRGSQRMGPNFKTAVVESVKRWRG